MRIRTLALVCLLANTGRASGAQLPPRVRPFQAVPLAAPLPGHLAGPALPAVSLHVDERAWDEIEASTVAWIDGVPLSDGSSIDLRLRRMDPFTADARIVVVEAGPDGRPREREIARPRLSAWAGEVSGRPGSRALIARSAAGLHGYVQFDGRTEILSTGIGNANVPMMSDASLLGIEAPRCQDPPPLEVDAALEIEAPLTAFATAACRQLPIAVDTDQELLAKFANDTDAASAYVATMFAGLMDIYSRDFNVRPGISYLRWWTTTDPWTITSGTSSQLSEFRTYWNANMRTTPRALATLLSGRGLGGGVAWLSTVCSSTAGSGSGYSVSADLDGSFPYPLSSPHSRNWDINVLAHEIGHNMSARHTHELGLDDCYLPDGSGLGACTQKLQGTIMSYCHQCSGGLSNINLNFDGTNIAAVVSYMAGRSCTAPATALPVASDDTFTALEGSPTALDVLANDLPANCETVTIIGLPSTSTLGVPLSVNATGSPSGGPAIAYSPAPGVRGADSFTYQLRDASNQTSRTVTVSVDVQPVLQGFAGLSDNVAGMAARYYALTAPTDIPDFAALAPSRVATVPSLSFGSTTGSCVGSGQTDNVGAVFEGWIEVPSDGTYAFSLTSDAGSELYLDGLLVVDNGGLHTFSEKVGTISMKAGFHAVRVLFFEATGTCGLWLKWAPPGTTTRVLVPASALSRGGRVNDLDGSGVVDNGDVAFVLVSFGTECPGARCYGDPDDRQYIGLEPCDCPEDIDGSGVIDFGDVAMLLLY
jgi:hypothetical protein